jgi:SAM-dependent methyltransferase
MYLRERIKKMRPGRFVEIGPGAGHVTALLLDAGWTGVAYDLEASTVSAVIKRFSKEIESGRFHAETRNWLSVNVDEQVDLVISCMVMEHFDDEGERAFIDAAKSCLVPSGLMVALVPASLDHWGIEDEIAGHFRRYSYATVRTKFESLGWQVRHLAGLTFPISNMLFPVSNYLVRKSEARKLSLSMVERTKQSGIRDVPMKTNFPSVFGLLLNETTMIPLHWVQKLFLRSNKAMVLYIEATPSP